MSTQGSEFRATLGFGTESRWDSCWRGYGVVKFWDLRTGRALIDLPWPGGGGDELVAAPDGGMLISIGKDGRLQVWR